MVKKLLYLLLSGTGLMTLGVSCAVANIGETYKQSCARYGQSKEHAANGAWWILDNDNTVAETFAPNGRCDAIWYRRFSGTFNGDEILTRIAFNIPAGQDFYETTVEAGRFWKTANYSRTALLILRDNQGEGRNAIELSIWTKGHHERIEAAKATTPDQNQTVDVDGSVI